MSIDSTTTKGGMYTGSYTSQTGFDETKYNNIKKIDANGYSTSDIDTNTAKDAYGNSYTTSVSNDQLSTSDFLALMLQELKLQDPTKPMDSQSMMDTQMQMSSMQTNMTLSNSMQELVSTFNQSALSNASTLIGRNIETNQVDEDGVTKAYTVTSVETQGGDLVLKGRQILYMQDIVKDGDGNVLQYDKDGYIYGSDGEKTGEKIVLESKGNIALDENNKPIILDADNNTVEDNPYTYTGQNAKVYSDEISSIPMGNVAQIFS